MTENKTLLLVDDNLPFRMLIKAYLQKAGYQTREADNGEQALLLLTTEKIDMVLLDLQMQPMGGFDFMPVYQESGFTMPVVLVTGDPSSDILMRAPKLGFAGVLKKPVTEERLLSIVKRFL